MTVCNGENTGRFVKFGDATKHYQKILEAIPEATLAKKPRLEIMKLKKLAKTAHENLHSKFKSESSAREFSLIRSFASKAKFAGAATLLVDAGNRGIVSIWW